MSQSGAEENIYLITVLREDLCIETLKHKNLSAVSSEEI
jgi:hypothetical protein